MTSTKLCLIQRDPVDSQTISNEPILKSKSKKTLNKDHDFFERIEKQFRQNRKKDIEEETKECDEIQSKKIDSGTDFSGFKSTISKGKGNAMTPKEYFDMNRLKNAAIASKMTGSHTVLLQSTTGVQDSSNLKSNQKNDSLKQQMNELSEVLKDMKLKKEDSDQDRNDGEGDCKNELLDRGPIPLQHSYKGYQYQPYAANPAVPMPTAALPVQASMRYVQMTPQQYMHAQHARQVGISANYMMQPIATAAMEASYPPPQQRSVTQQQVAFNDSHLQMPPSIVTPPLSSSPPQLLQPSQQHHGVSNASTTCAKSERRVIRELQRLLNDNRELPDDLSDFILKYSRRYSSCTPSPALSDCPSPPSSCYTNKSNSRKNSTDSALPSSPSGSEISIGSADSPFSTGKSSPVEERRKMSPVLTETIIFSAKNAQGSPPGQRRQTKARDRLRAMINPADFEAGWVWSAKSWLTAPDSLCFLRDDDGDTFLHRVVYHRDLAKIYGLVEHMMKDNDSRTLKPFDQPNNSNETALFVAVQRRMEEVVGYLVECGANPNLTCSNASRDACLHYAASRGMCEIVDALLQTGSANPNQYNGAGLTPLLCAVKFHGVIEEESQCLVNNKPVIRRLLKGDADAKLPEMSWLQKTVLHLAVERMDPELIEIFREHLNEEEIRALVNRPTVDGQTPLDLLAALANQNQKGSLRAGDGEEDLRRKVFLSLVDCGAQPSSPHNVGQTALPD